MEGDGVGGRTSLGGQWELKNANLELRIGPPAPPQSEAAKGFGDGPRNGRAGAFAGRCAL